VKYLASPRIRIVAAPMNTGIPDAGTLGQAELADWVNVERRGISWSSGLHSGFSGDWSSISGGIPQAARCWFAKAIAASGLVAVA
jgi:hypothetical protein